MKQDKRRVLVLGAAGFIGSHVARRFAEAGCSVTAVDGLVPGTGGCESNLKPCSSLIRFVISRVEGIRDMEDLVRNSDAIVDCMAWTSHWGALEKPLVDLQLNVESHLHWLTLARERPDLKVVYLGTRVQYGRPKVPSISEETPQIPEDVQGIHKVAAESYFRVYSGLHGFASASLRFPNCFGRHQPVATADAGLIGSFILDLLQSREVVVYGENRARELVYAPDVAEVIFRISNSDWRGFLPLNLAGQSVPLCELARLLVDLVGRGSYRVELLPAQIAQIDTGMACLNDRRLRDLIGEVPRADLRTALADTVAYFREKLPCCGDVT